MRKLIFAAVILSVLFLAAVFMSRVGCEFFDGKWGQAEGVCTTRLCYYFGNCGKWAQPVARCLEVKIGDSRAEVVFQFGEPDLDEKTRLSWRMGKGESEMFSAYFEGDTLRAIECEGGAKYDNYK